MLGFLGAGSGEWLSMLQALKLALTAQNLRPQLFRVGGSNAIPLASFDPARNRCFFTGCDGYAPVSSTLHSLWAQPANPRGLPLRLMLSDLEVNDTDVNDLVGAVQADVRKGATIGVLAVKLPFDGTIFDSQGRTIHVGRARRPLYLLASGEAARVRQLLEAVRENLSLRGVSTQDLHISLLGNPAQSTLVARSSQGDPPGSVTIGVPVTVGDTLYEPGSNPDMQLLKLLPGNRGVRISSAAALPGPGTAAPAGLATLSPLGPGTSGSGISLQSLEVAGTSLTANLRIDPSVTATALRLTVPAGSLPEEWWLLWNRTNPRSAQARDQTDGLLLAMTKLGQALSPPGAPPAAVFCLAVSRGDGAGPGGGQGGAIVAVLAAILVLALLGALVVQQIRQAQDDSDEGADDP